MGREQEMRRKLDRKTRSHLSNLSLHDHLYDGQDKLNLGIVIEVVGGQSILFRTRLVVTMAAQRVSQCM